MFFLGRSNRYLRFVIRIRLLIFYRRDCAIFVTLPIDAPVIQTSGGFTYDLSIFLSVARAGVSDDLDVCVILFNDLPCGYDRFRGLRFGF